MEGDGLRAEGEFLAFIWLVSITTGDSMVTVNWHFFYVATFFLWYPNLVICYPNM